MERAVSDVDTARSVYLPRPMSLARTLLLRASRSPWLAEQFRKRAFARRAVRKFMPGESLGEALDAAAALSRDNLGTVLTQLGEQVLNAAEATAVRDHYLQVFDQIRQRSLPAHVSVKLTHLGLDVSREACTRHVLDLLIAMPERHRFVRGMVAWIGGKQVPLPYDRKARVAGESKYPLSKMLRFAADAITAFSIVPLMASMTIGWVMAAVGFAFFVYSIIGWALGHTLPGWTSLMAAIGLLGGMQFLMLGIIGAYLGRLYDQSKGRPLFMIGEIVGGDR